MIEPKLYKGKQGVYKIAQPDGRFYIGSSIEIYNRLRAHKSYFSKECRDYKKINYTCNWQDLNIEILEETSNLSSKELKKIENKYLSKMWSDKILNIETKSEGRLITNENNPNWKGVKLKKNFCSCGKQISLSSHNCYSCTAKNRNRDGFQRFV